MYLLQALENRQKEKNRRKNLFRYSALKMQATCRNAGKKTGSRGELARNRKQKINARIIVRETAEVQQAV